MTSKATYTPGVESGFNLFLDYMNNQYGKDVVKKGIDSCKDKKWTLVRENFRAAPNALLVNGLAEVLTASIRRVANEQVDQSTSSSGPSTEDAKQPSFQAAPVVLPAATEVPVNKNNSCSKLAVVAALVVVAAAYLTNYFLHNS